MPRPIVLMAALLVSAAPAFALDLPTRKAGLWEIKMEFQGYSNLPMQTMKQCTDAGPDKLMTYNFGGSAEKKLPEAGLQPQRQRDRHRLSVRVRRSHHHLARGDQRRLQRRLYRRGDLDT